MVEVVLCDGELFVWLFVVVLCDVCDYLVVVLWILLGVEVLFLLGVMYLFLWLLGVVDSLVFCMMLVCEVGFGFVFGCVFGLEGEGFVCWCYVCDLVWFDVGVEWLCWFFVCGMGVC